MKPTYTRRHRQKTPSSRDGGMFKKESQSGQSFFGESSYEPFFQPAQAIQRKCDKCEEDDKKVNRMPEEKKEEEKKLQRQPEKKEEEKLQRASDKKEEEDKKLQRQPEKKEEEKLQKKESSTQTAASTNTKTNYINSLNCKGQSLPSRQQFFFGGRMGHDFSNVKVHSDKEAIESAKSFNAKAYTIGKNIVFGEGQYNPETTEGKKLLAHELAHVAQQDSEYSLRRIIQRAKIDYKHLSWNDFSGTPPTAIGNEGAAINTGFDLPGYGISPDTKKLKGKGSKCKIGKRKAYYYESKVVLNPLVFDTMTAYMDPDKSWVIDRYKQTPAVYCASEITKCERQFDSMVAAIASQCNKIVLECEDAFNKKHWSSFGEQIGTGTVVAKNARECRTNLLPQCNRLLLSGASITFGNLTITSKTQCNTTFKRACILNEPQENARLLKHEQGHFDITKVIADKVRAAIQDKIKTSPTIVKECGEQEATDAALALYHTLSAEIDNLYTQGKLTRDRKQDEYDWQTNHGTNAAQTTWEGNIAAGLPDVSF